jgi:pimeloyl-ACP methyl ester carboxylesterase
MEINQVNYIVHGDGPPVILIHGMAASLCDWNELIPELVHHGYSTYALDLLGHGDSAKPDDPGLYNVDFIYKHFLTWLDSLQLKEPPILIGHSLGGYISLMHALHQPQAIRSLVLIDPYYEIKQVSSLVRLAQSQPSLGEKAMRITPMWMINLVLRWSPESIAPFSERKRQQIAIDYKRASPHFVYITRKIPDLTDSLKQVNVPALVLWGDRDQTLHPASFPRLVQALPNAVGHPIPATGHQPHISKPNQVYPFILGFIKNLS